MDVFNGALVAGPPYILMGNLEVLLRRFKNVNE